MAHKSILFCILVIINSTVGQSSSPEPECYRAKNPLGECCGDQQLWINENCTQVDMSSQEIKHCNALSTLTRDSTVTTFLIKLMWMVVFQSAPRTKSSWRILAMEDPGGALNRILEQAPSVPALLTQVRKSGSLLKNQDLDDCSRVRLYWNRGGVPHRRVRMRGTIKSQTGLH